MISPEQILSKYWGYDSFRNPQREIIEDVLAKKNVVALLPTGSGKSICFQVPALLIDGVCIVVSPLIALMQDQVSALKKKGIKATLIPSASSVDEIVTLFDAIKFGNVKFLYISPERLQSVLIQNKIKELNVALFAIDESHCISEWGHDFRPSYRNIKSILELKPNANCIALTATATQKVLTDIVTNLELEVPIYHKGDLLKTNIKYKIQFADDKLYQLRKTIQNSKVSIVYVNSRAATKQLSNYLNKNNYKSTYYHGGLSKTEKEQSFSSWMLEKTPIMVATNAFGMGIDKANVDLVVHYNIPHSIENFVQETGRAGRNNFDANAVLISNNNDVRLFKDQIENATPTLEEIKKVFRSLFQNYNIALGELSEESFDFNFSYFTDKYKLPKNKAATTIKILINNGIISVTQNFNKKSSIQFLVSSNHLISLSKTSKLIEVILRTYSGVFEKETYIDEFYLAKKIGITSEKVIQELEKLKANEIIKYKSNIASSSIVFNVPREDDRTINRFSKEIKSYLKQKHEKGDSILNFISNDEVCRNKQLSLYFDQYVKQDCLKCDVCNKKHKSKEQISELVILELLNTSELDSKSICLKLEAPQEDILVLLRKLLREEKIKLNSNNTFSVL